MVRVDRVLGEVLGWDDRLVVLLVLLVHMHVIVIARRGLTRTAVHSIVISNQ
jgi:hypothetical protein